MAGGSFGPTPEGAMPPWVPSVGPALVVPQPTLWFTRRWQTARAETSPEDPQVSTPSPSTRLYAILARKAPLAVVFRRGPSKQVLLLRWDTKSHSFEAGQWFKGRIYERRCDLTPSGEKLVYFAAKHRSPHYSWTAVSRPPFLTALAMWPKGDCWGGGGLFRNERSLQLNHPPGQTSLAEGFRLPGKIKVEPFGGNPGGGEDDPIHSARLLRDGWVFKQDGAWQTHQEGERLWIECTVPAVWAKPQGGLTLEMRLLGIRERDGPWYVTEHAVTGPGGEVVLDVGRSDWADWSRSGELLYAKAGRLYRAAADPRRGLGEPEELIDLRGLRFEAVEAPPEAKLWGGRPVAGLPLPCV